MKIRSVDPATVLPALPDEFIICRISQYEICNWKEKDSKGVQTISRELEAKQVPKLRGEPIWSKHGILYILTNERYAGNELFRKSYRTESIPFKKIDNFGE